MEDQHHQIWKELERYFRVRIGRYERQKITQLMGAVMAQYPDLQPEEMTDTTLEVVHRVLGERQHSP